MTFEQLAYGEFGKKAIRFVCDTSYVESHLGVALFRFARRSE